MTLRVLYLSRAERFPEALEGYLDAVPGNYLRRCDTPEEVEHALQRGIVELLLIDADGGFDAAADLCTRLKADPFNSVVPIVFYSREHRMEQIATAFERGADNERADGDQAGQTPGRRIHVRAIATLTVEVVEERLEVIARLGADEALGKGICLRCADRCLDHRDAFYCMEPLRGAIGRSAVHDDDLVGSSRLRGDRREERADVLVGVQHGGDQ